MYFLLLMLKSRRKRSALQPQTVYSEFPQFVGAANGRPCAERHKSKKSGTIARFLQPSPLF